MKIAIGIATAGRRDVLTETVLFLQNQSRQPDAILICPAAPQDCDENLVGQMSAPTQIVRSAAGLTSQRNAIIAQSDADVLVFFDDDFMPTADFLAEIEILFTADPSIVVATGDVLADGILSEGLDHAQGLEIIANAPPNTGGAAFEVHNGYGCNMAIRLAPVKANGIRFDETLPLYGWLEDVDFSKLLGRFGRVVKSPRLRGVHLGTKRSGRSPGKKLGYSQIANPVYMARKGTISWPHALRQMIRNLAANTVRSVNPEPWVDRKGRLKGNLLAVADLLLRRITPLRILDLK